MQFLRINLYEIQVLLYWIVGLMVLYFGTWKWVGWLAIGYGWFTLLVTMVVAVKYRKEVREELTSKEITSLGE